MGHYNVQTTQLHPFPTEIFNFLDEFVQLSQPEDKESYDVTFCITLPTYQFPYLKIQSVYGNQLEQDQIKWDIQNAFQHGITNIHNWLSLPMLEDQTWYFKNNNNDIKSYFGSVILNKAEKANNIFHFNSQIKKGNPFFKVFEKDEAIVLFHQYLNVFDKFRFTDTNSLKPYLIVFDKNKNIFLLEKYFVKKVHELHFQFNNLFQELQCKTNLILNLLPYNKAASIFMGVNSVEIPHFLRNSNIINNHEYEPELTKHELMELERFFKFVLDILNQEIENSGINISYSAREKDMSFQKALLHMMSPPLTTITNNTLAGIYNYNLYQIAQLYIHGENYINDTTLNLTSSLNFIYKNPHGKEILFFYNIENSINDVLDLNNHHIIVVEISHEYWDGFPNILKCLYDLHYHSQYKSRIWDSILKKRLFTLLNNVNSNANGITFDINRTRILFTDSKNIQNIVTLFSNNEYTPIVINQNEAKELLLPLWEATYVQKYFPNFRNELMSLQTKVDLSIPNPYFPLEQYLNCDIIDIAKLNKDRVVFINIRDSVQNAHPDAPHSIFLYQWDILNKIHVLINELNKQEFYINNPYQIFLLSLKNENNIYTDLFSFLNLPFVASDHIFTYYQTLVKQITEV